MFCLCCRHKVEEISASTRVSWMACFHHCQSELEPIKTTEKLGRYVLSTLSYLSVGIRWKEGTLKAAVFPDSFQISPYSCRYKEVILTPIVLLLLLLFFFFLIHVKGFLSPHLPVMRKLILSYECASPLLPLLHQHLLNSLEQLGEHLGE